MALKMGAADFVGEVANSNPVVSTITSFLCFEQLTAEPILLFRTQHEQLLLMRSLWRKPIGECLAIPSHL
jgi:hypothetical protein